MNIANALEKAIKELKRNDIDEKSNKARRILAYVLGEKKEYLITHDFQELTKSEERNFIEKIDLLIKGKPIQYIIGMQEFMNIDFIVNENVLIPQPDTECLVEETIKIATKMEKPRILDLCTGSGAIAVSISKYVKEAKITATDISKEALQVAVENDRDNKIDFIQADLFENIEKKFNIIVSNPPYIKTEEIKSLSKEVQNEPQLALDGGKDGLDFYRKIIQEAPNYLETNGYLCLEIGEDQKEEVTKLIQASGKYREILHYKDLENHDRVIITMI